VKKAASSAGEAVLGVRLSGAQRDAVAALRAAGADFIVLDLDSAMADALLEENVGSVLVLDAQADETTLRLAGGLGLDAIVTAVPDGPFTLARALELRRLSGISRTPLLAAARADAGASTLQVMRDSGVMGVIVRAGDIPSLGALRERIAALPSRGQRREERAEALLPAGVHHVHEEEEEEDE